METKYNKTEILTSLLWKLLERSGTQGMQFIVQIVLARLLLPLCVRRDVVGKKYYII